MLLKLRLAKSGRGEGCEDIVRKSAMVVVRNQEGRNGSIASSDVIQQ
jgi:hypothetical protein